MLSPNHMAAGGFLYKITQGDAPKKGIGKKYMCVCINTVSWLTSERAESRIVLSPAMQVLRLFNLALQPCLQSHSNGAALHDSRDISYTASYSLVLRPVGTALLGLSSPHTFLRKAQ